MASAIRSSPTTASASTSFVQSLSCGQGKGVDFQEACVGGLRLLEVVAGYDRLILVDAIRTPDGTPEQGCRLSVDDQRASMHAGSTHDLSFRGTLAWGRRIGMVLPLDDTITIIAVEVEDVLTFGKTLTPTVLAALPDVVEAVLVELARDPRRP